MAEESLRPEGQEPDPTPPAPPPVSQDAGDEPTSAEGMAEDALQAAQDALSDMSGAPSSGPTKADFLDDVQAAVDESASTPSGHADDDRLAAALDLPAFGGNGAGGERHGIDLLKDVNLQVKIELGRTRMLVEDVLRLGQGSVVELDKLAGDPVDVYVNDRPVARGEVLVLNDSFCVRISEILKPAGDPAEE